MRLRSAIADLRRRPGIHTPCRGYGFRARASARPGMTELSQRPDNDDYPFVIPGWSEGPGPESRDSGFALHAPRNDDGWMLNQPAAVGDAAQVIVGIAKGVLDHGEPLEIVADLGFHGHADAAMQLDRLLADEFQRLAHPHLSRRLRGGALL